MFPAIAAIAMHRCIALASRLALLVQQYWRQAFKRTMAFEHCGPASSS
jgi:hypothetical protein